MSASGNPDRPAFAQGDWLVITSYEHKVVTSYDTREEAEAAVEWLRETYPSGPLVEYCHA